MRATLLHITKDVFIIVVCGILFFILTHNSIVRPTPLLYTKAWTIELHQRPLAFGLAGHNFIMLKDESSSIVTTLHGLPTDIKTGAWKYVGREETDILRVWELGKEIEEGEKRGSYGITLMKGTREEVLARFELARNCGDLINQKNIPYPPYGVAFRKEMENSNSVAYTLVSCMNLEARHIGLFTPGWGKNVLEQ